jgi:hypothetical protein
LQSTFYQPPAMDLAEKWRRDVPQDFRYCLKGTQPDFAGLWWSEGDLAPGIGCYPTQAVGSALCFRTCRPPGLQDASRLIRRNSGTEDCALGLRSVAPSHPNGNSDARLACMCAACVPSSEPVAT